MDADSDGMSPPSHKGMRFPQALDGVGESDDVLLPGTIPECGLQKRQYLGYIALFYFLAYRLFKDNGIGWVWRVGRCFLKYRWGSEYICDIFRISSLI